MGPASEGGYLGADFKAFFSAVSSGAAGSYMVTLMGDAGITTDLTIRPGQDVRISGGVGLVVAPSWGNGSFTVQQGGSLSLAGVALPGTHRAPGWGVALTVQGGGNATVSGGSLVGPITVQSGGYATVSGGAVTSQITVQSGGALDLSTVVVPPQVMTVPGSTVTRGTTAASAAVCTALVGHYTTLSDAYRATSTGGGNHGDCASKSGVGGGGWYCFSGAGGDALPLQPPGAVHCGTQLTVWLSGWRGSGAGTTPPGVYSTPGRFPTAAEGVAEMTACFDVHNPNAAAGYWLPGHHCYGHVVVGVVMCDGFLLWRLPYVPVTNAGYCTAPSGL